MKRQIILLTGIAFVFGISVGYFVSLGNSFTKYTESASALPAAAAAMNDFSDHDMAVILRLVGGGVAGKDMSSDGYVHYHIARYYLQRSALPPEQQSALGAAGLLTRIEKLADSSPEFKKKLEAERAKP